MRRDRRGFTLVEMLVACGLMCLVMLGVMAVTTSALRAHYQQIRSNENSTAELYGIDDMVRTFENTSHLEACYPSPSPASYCAASSNYQQVRGCLNWSQSMSPAGPIDAAGAAAGTDPEEWYDYCWAAPGGNGPNKEATLFKYSKQAACPSGAWPAITAANCGTTVSGVTPQAVVLNFYPTGYPGNTSIFTRVDWKGGISMQFTVGIATANYSGTGVASVYATAGTPVSYNMTTGSGMQKNYNVPYCGASPCD